MTPEPSRLPTIVEDGSDTEVSTKEDTSSPVNLVDNNRRKTKAEIAQRKAVEISQKKAEKKARQREKKVKFELFCNIILTGVQNRNKKSWKLNSSHNVN